MKEKLTKNNPYPQVWQNMDGRNPSGEMGYIRADNDGFKWWSKAFPIHKELETKELIAELDSVFEAFTAEFPTMDELADFCLEKAEPTSDPDEFNAYLELEYGFYWFRMITRTHDYNLYLHCISKTAMSE